VNDKYCFCEKKNVISILLSVCYQYVVSMLSVCYPYVVWIM